MSEPDNVSLELDETEQRLNAEFSECVRERAIAEGKIVNQSRLYADYIKFRKAADAIADRCDQIRLKLREHKKAKAAATGLL